MDTSEIRKGVKMMVDGRPCVVVDFQFVKPGKGQAFTRLKAKSLVDGSVLERTYKSGEKLERADVEDRSMQFIYQEGDNYVFMHEASGEQIMVPSSKMEDEAKWVSDGMTVDVTLWNGQPIGISLPSSVTLQITHSEPGIKGDTSGGASKPATLSTGAIVQVPLFVNEGEWVRVDTESGKYVERVNKK